jgi:AraC-like DNA-binding protein
MKKEQPTRMTTPNPGSRQDIYHMRRVVTTNQIETHWHNFFEIDFIDGGEGTHTLNGTARPYSKGTLTVLGTFDFHSYAHELAEPRFSAYSFHFNDSVPDAKTLSRLSRLAGVQLLCEDEEMYRTLVHCFERLEQECLSAHKERDAMVRHLLGQISIYASRCKRQSDVREGETRMHTEMEYIERNFRQPLSLGEVAKIAGYSEDYFGKLFKRQYGCAFQEYLLGRRLQWAYGLLRSSSRSITEIAYEAGFNSHAYFCRCFKKRYGITPLQARRESEVEF